MMLRMSMNSAQDVSEPSERLTVSLPRSLARRLRVQAEVDRRSVSAIVREALEGYSKGLEQPELPSFTAIGRGDGSGVARRAEEIIAAKFRERSGK